MVNNINIVMSLCMFVCYFGLPKLYNNNITLTVTLCWIKLTILSTVPRTVSLSFFICCLIHTQAKCLDTRAIFKNAINYN